MIRLLGLNVSPKQVLEDGLFEMQSPRPSGTRMVNGKRVVQSVQNKQKIYPDFDLYLFEE